MTKKTVTGVTKTVLKFFGVLMFVAIFLIGCSKSDLPHEQRYEFKQIQHGDSGTTYVACIRCIDYTKIEGF
ncbi:MAG: hypothetical protein ACD_69C00353G0006 [uncultured bacterium]|nr:MAG: hypothetical protein ACD_69C00353G0006 [uncultured bacterium]